MSKDPEHGAKGRVAQRVPELLLHLFVNGRARKVFPGRIERGQATLRTRLGDKDLVVGQMARHRVVLCVCNPPAVVWHAQSRVQDPSDGVIERLALAERLMSTLVRENPETSRDEPSRVAVRLPAEESARGVEVRDSLVQGRWDGSEDGGREREIGRVELGN